MEESNPNFLCNPKPRSNSRACLPSTARGFTIVELLVVIVVIGILAAITIISYTGISQKATIASVTSDLDNASKQLKLDQVTNSAYPATLAAANNGRGIPASPDTTYQYSVDNTTSPQSFCIMATKGNVSYKITNDGAPTAGACLDYGLALSLDAGNSASYPGSGTTWTDLSGDGNNGTLMNGVGYSSANDGSLVFDGVDDKVQTNYGPQFNDYTVCIWYKDNSSGGYGRLVDKSYTGGFWLGRNGGTSSSWGGGIRESSGPYGVFLTLADGNWNFLVSERQGTTHRLYGNGIVNITSNTVSSTALDSTTIAIGGWSAGSQQWFKGNIAVVIVYDRALSSTDVQQIFDSTRSRFGI